MELGMGEMVLIALVALLVYGGRLPEVAAAVGRSLAELKRGLRDTTDTIRGEFDTFSELRDLDPRRAIGRAWNAPRLTETPRDQIVPVAATAVDAEPPAEGEGVPAAEAEARPDPATETAEPAEAAEAAEGTGEAPRNPPTEDRPSADPPCGP